MWGRVGGGVAGRLLRHSFLETDLPRQGRTIKHCEYFHVAKGRDLGFNTVLGFFSKQLGIAWPMKKDFAWFPT